MKFIFTCILTVLLLVTFKSFAQTDSAFLAHTINSLDRYSLANPVEKVYLHLDKQAYMPGDTIWFKAYTVAGENHGLSAISNIVHVELLTEKDSVINRIAIPLSTGIGWGDFALPVLTRPGSYQIRAYTNW
uniref:MG2 domain-containing protein n=1 Tax=Mucilaginibacter sp. TaxID=1882438 RepID=UPI003428FB18